jgi:hypothetical protein
MRRSPAGHALALRLPGEAGRDRCGARLPSARGRCPRPGRSGDPQPGAGPEAAHACSGMPRGFGPAALRRGTTVHSTPGRAWRGGPAGGASDWRERSVHARTGPQGCRLGWRLPLDGAFRPRPRRWGREAAAGPVSRWTERSIHGHGVPGSEPLRRRLRPGRSVPSTRPSLGKGPCRSRASAARMPILLARESLRTPLRESGSLPPRHPRAWRAGNALARGAPTPGVRPIPASSASRGASGADGRSLLEAVSSELA